MYRSFFKRFFDISFAFIGIIIFFPLVLLMCIIVGITMKESPFFIQERPGLNEKLFKLIKIKTMNKDNDIHGDLLSDFERITSLGRFLRKTSIDELPQLINVIKGEMSLIGPRPLLIEYLPYYSDYQHRRHEVRPGITGWAQINGRNTINWEQKFEYDVWYVDNLSIKLDAKIVFLTIKRIFCYSTINNSDNMTMPKFIGNINDN